jgi:pyruvate,water dikinase
MNMSKLKFSILSLVVAVSGLYGSLAHAQAKVMNPGEAYGQLIYLSADDVRSESAKYKVMNPLSIPVFAELPLDLSVVAGAITLSQQNLLSHVQLKSRARHTPNLDISGLPQGLSNPLFINLHDGDWVHMVLTATGGITIVPATEKQAQDYYNKKHSDPMALKADVKTSTIFKTSDLIWSDSIKVGSKAANYGELAKAVNTPEQTYVLPGYAVPFYYYQQFIDSNPNIKAMIDNILHDPMMNKVTMISYRKEKLQALSDLIMSKDTVVSQKLVDQLIPILDQIKTSDGLPKKFRVRSSTNSEDLTDFNGAGLYSSTAYKPVKNKQEKTREEKEASLKKALKTVWASIWNLRAFEERVYYQIPHMDVKMGMQLNPAYENEEANGVVVTKNVAKQPSLTGQGVYIESQRGHKYSVTNPEPGIIPEKFLVEFDPAQPANRDLYKIDVIERSNIADDGTTVLPSGNPNPTMSDKEIKELTALVLKAHSHFKPLLGRDNPEFSLDLEFKVDAEQTGVRQVYLKQARPYID